MSRWGKNRPPSFTLPLDALVKEKENTNRPVAARSAGTIGKWGITSFTSMRASSGYAAGFLSFSPKQESFQYPNISPKDITDYQTPSVPTPEVTPTPKPKKFFKSRNTAPETSTIGQACSSSGMGLSIDHPSSSELLSTLHSNDFPKTKAAKKTSKKRTKAEEKRPKVEEKPKVKAEKPKEKPKVVKKKSKAETKVVAAEKVKPTRVLSRTRRAVNYTEDKSRSPTPAQPPILPASEAPVGEIAAQPNHVPPTDQGEAPALNEAWESPSKLANSDHPPIVLRISKGTSRLISTDSEGISSPPYASPPQQPQEIPTAYSAAAAELVAVLSDNPHDQFIAKTEESVVPEEPMPILTPPKSKPLSKSNQKETKSTKAKNNNNRKTANKQRATRTTRRKQQQLSADEEEIDQNDDIEEKQGHSSSLEINESSNQLKAIDTQTNIEQVRSDLTADQRVPEPLNETITRANEHLPQQSETILSGSVLNMLPDDQQNSGINHKSVESMRISEVADNTKTSTIIPKKRPIRKIQEEASESVPAVVNKKRKGKVAAVVAEAVVDTVAPVIEVEQPKTRASRVTRNNNNKNMLQEKEQESVMPPVKRSYGRKRKLSQTVDTPALPLPSNDIATGDERNLLLPADRGNVDHSKITLAPVDSTLPENHFENSTPKVRYKHSLNSNGTERATSTVEEPMCTTSGNLTSTENAMASANNDEDDKPSVKLVISKKKGSIFKSRAIDQTSGESKKPKRHLYKHKWDDDLDEEKGSKAEKDSKTSQVDAYTNEFDDDAPPTVIDSGTSNVGYSRLARPTRSNESDFVIRNVKKAHQMQEIGEFQEMDDDVEYILESLKSHNPIATRTLAAIQLASKCMTPAFRMHVRAHGTATQFFAALHDATKNQSLGLCTATIMFVLIQDNLNMDLDKDSLELMLNLLDSDLSHRNNCEDSGLTEEQLQRNELKVIEICREIKSQGKAVHLSTENLSVGTLAMETLLTLTSKRAGEWFKDELRQLGGLEHIINTICECCKQISDYVVDWTENLLEKLRKIERCMRVLENVSERNADNQIYILNYKEGHAVETLVKFYKLCDREITLYPTNETTPSESPGVVLREALVPTLKVLINLTHTFNNTATGSIIFGKQPIIFDTSLHLLFQAQDYVPEKCIFELSLLVLLLLINLTMYTPSNRAIIMEASAPSDFGSQFIKVPAIKALIHYFYKYEEQARFVEQNTDRILDNPDKKETKPKSQEEIEETVSALLQKAGNHMEHTMLASYVCLLVGHLVMDHKPHETAIRKYLRNSSFSEMVHILDKYYNFMNLTASSEASQVAHMKETKQIIQYLKESDLHSNELDGHTSVNRSHGIHAASTSSARAPSSSGEDSSTKMFNQIYHSGR